MRQVDGLDLVTRPVGPAELPELARLFGGDRNTRHCWCTAFCTTRGQFAAGWLTGGNRRRFEGMARDSATLMGVLAWTAGEPVGWGACGPRSRYGVADGGRGKLLRGRDRDYDGSVWLLACLFVRSDHRGRGVTYALVRAAVDLARAAGAVAIEGWPVVGSGGAAAFVGREKVFEELGFRRVARPTSRRSIVRLRLDGS